MVVVTDLDSRVFPRRAFRVKAGGVAGTDAYRWRIAREERERCAAEGAGAEPIADLR